MTTNPAPVHTFIDTSLPPINPGAPAELDSTPVSPVARKDSWQVRSGGTIAGPGADQEVYEELSGEAGANESIRQVRTELGTGLQASEMYLLQARSEKNC
jgi:hypothetical protein